MRVAVMVLLLLLLSVPAARAERVLRVAYTDDVATFDPDDAIILYGLDAARVLYEGLVQYRPGSTEIEGWLAESWTVSPDGLTYSFRLRDGIVFHDGRPLTAAAVLAYFERRRNPTFPLSYFLDNVQAMAAPDARTFVITLKQPEPAFLDRLASPWAPKVIGPEALIDHAGSDFAVGWLNDHADGTGPFLLAEMVRGQRYVLVRNPRYWGPPPWFDRIEILIVPTINQQMLMLARGELDIVEHGYPFDQLDRLPPGVVADAHDVLGLEMAYLNPAKALADPAVRRAVMTMLDPARWLHDLFGSYATPAKSLYPKAMIEGPAPVVFPNDLEAARRAVRAHGPVSLEIGYSDQEAPVQQRIAETFVSLLKEIGIDATVRSVPIDQESSLVNDLKRSPDIFIAQNYPDAAHPATQTGVFFQTGAALNFFGFSDPEIDRRIDEAGRIGPVADRNAAYLDISDRLFAAGSFVPLADIKDVIVYRADLTDLNIRPALPWAVDYGTIRRK